MILEKLFNPKEDDREIVGQTFCAECGVWYLEPSDFPKDPKLITEKNERYWLHCPICQNSMHVDT